jgi:hypothetical protein
MNYDTGKGMESWNPYLVVPGKGSIPALQMWYTSIVQPGRNIVLRHSQRMHDGLYSYEGSCIS